MGGKITIFTDGSCHPNPGPGGWAAVLIHENIITEISGGVPNTTTNNRMEMLAAIESLQHLTVPHEVELYSDSAYLVNCFKQRWYDRWLKNGWRNSRGDPVENQDLWERLLQLTAIHKVTFLKVKGHTDNEYNNRCDALAKIAREA